MSSNGVDGTNKSNAEDVAAALSDGAPAPRVNAAKIDGLRASFEAFRSNTRDRLSRIQTTIVAIGTGIIGGLASIIATLIQLL